MEKIDDNKELITELKNKLKANKLSLLELIHKIQIKFSSYYQLQNQENLQEIGLIQNKESMTKIFQNILSDINNLEDLILHFFEYFEKNIQKL
ncbi:MAG: hypothetical protein ACTSPY_17420 [Candidatus Helarchaeota archaeon]